MATTREALTREPRGPPFGVRATISSWILQRRLERGCRSHRGNIIVPRLANLDGPSQIRGTGIPRGVAPALGHPKTVRHLLRAADARAWAAPSCLCMDCHNQHGTSLTLPPEDALDHLLRSAACLAAVLMTATPQPTLASLHTSEDRGEAERIAKIILSLPKPPVLERLVGLPSVQPKGRGHYLPLVAREAERRGLPAAVADAVVMVESAYDPSVIGTIGEMGLMQVRPGTAAMLGFTGSKEALAEPDTNIRYGVEYLAQAWRLAGGNLCRTLMKYRAGHGEERMSPRSVEYCRRARVHLAAIGSPLAEDGTTVGMGRSMPVQIASAQPDQPMGVPRVTVEERHRMVVQRELARRFILAVARVGSQGKGEALRPTEPRATAPKIAAGRGRSSLFARR